MNSVVVINVDDWAGLFVNAVLKYEGHKVEVEHLAEHTPIETIIEINTHGPLENYLWEDGNFPETLRECLEMDYYLKREYDREKSNLHLR